MTRQTLKYKTWPRLSAGQFVAAGDVVLMPPGSTKAQARRALKLAQSVLLSKAPGEVAP
ncbi:MAG: hypothetical protein QM765_21035 [Myxococcales bacterium]